MNSLLTGLHRRQRTGSKPRCHVLTSHSRELVAEQLTTLIRPFGEISASDFWMPQGFENIDEAQLHKAQHLLPDEHLRKSLRSWWLADVEAGSVTPNWDIASTCTIDGKPGLLLVEAKAHHNELKLDDSCGARSPGNLERIAGAIDGANQALNRIQTGWNLSHESHYQLCNRFAWSWKLASLGIPVVLVYLGFLNANEMQHPFPDDKSWDNAVLNYASGLVPDGVWNSALMINNTPIYPLIRSKEILI